MQLRQTREHHRDGRTARRGSVLIEFAFIAFAFYLLFAGTIELGRMVTMSQTVQNAARVGARELALIPLPPTWTFDQAISSEEARTRIYDPYLLAIDVSSAAATPDTTAWPLVNQMLVPLMVRTRIGNQTFWHVPGAVLRETGGNRYTVGVPRITGRDENGVETVTWLPVLEEIRQTPGDVNTGTFSLASPCAERGLVSIRINVPYQATTLTAYRVVEPGGPMTPIQANDGAVLANNEAPGGTPIGTLPGDPEAGTIDPQNTYSGAYGLGNFYALGEDGPVRPFRRLISAQAMFRREVYGQ